MWLRWGTKFSKIPRSKKGEKKCFPFIFGGQGKNSPWRKKGYDGPKFISWLTCYILAQNFQFVTHILHLKFIQNNKRANFLPPRLSFLFWIFLTYIECLLPWRLVKKEKSWRKQIYPIRKAPVGVEQKSGRTNFIIANSNQEIRLKSGKSGDLPKSRF